MIFKAYLLKNKLTGKLETTEFGELNSEPYSWAKNRAISTKFYRGIKQAKAAISQNYHSELYDAVPVTVTIIEGHDA